MGFRRSLNVAFLQGSRGKKCLGGYTIYTLNFKRTENRSESLNNIERVSGRKTWFCRPISTRGNLGQFSKNQKFMIKFIQHAGYNTKVCSKNLKFKPVFSAFIRKFLSGSSCWVPNCDRQYYWGCWTLLSSFSIPFRSSKSIKKWVMKREWVRWKKMKLQGKNKKKLTPKDLE